MLQLLAELEQFDRFKQEERPLEVLYLKVRTLMRDVTAALREAPDNPELQEHLQRLAAEAADLERRAPWLISDYPVELTFWPGGPGVL